MDTVNDQQTRDYVKPDTLRPALRVLNEADLSDLQFQRTFDPLMCRILQLDALLCADGLWEAHRASDLRHQIAARQDDLETLYRTQGLLLEEYR